MGPFRFSKTRIPGKSGKVKSFTIQNAFKNKQVVQGRPLDCTRNKTISYPNNQSTIKIWYFLWLILLFNTQLRHILHTQINPFHLALFHPYRRRYVSLKYIINTAYYHILINWKKRFQNPPAT